MANASFVESDISKVRYFQPFYSDELPGDFKHSAIQAGKFCSRSVIDMTDEQGDQHATLDWQDLISRLNSYEDADLVFDKNMSHRISSQRRTLEVVVREIDTFLKLMLKDADITTILMAAFTHLQHSECQGWASWSKSDDELNSSWEYRLLYSFPMSGSDNKPDPDYIYTLVITVTLTADISTKSKWWELCKTTTQNFSAAVNAVELIVEKAFVNPN